MTERRKQDLTLKDAFEELERIAASFEGPSVDLEAGVRQFERGLELLHSIRKRLTAVSDRMEVLERKFRDLTPQGKDRDGET